MLRLVSSCCCRCSRTEETPSCASQNSNKDNADEYSGHEEQTDSPTTPNTETFASPNNDRPGYELETCAAGPRELEQTHCPQTTASNKELGISHDPNDVYHPIIRPEIRTATELQLMQTDRPHIAASGRELGTSYGYEEDIHAIRSAKLRARPLPDIPEDQLSIAASTSGAVSRRANGNGKFMNNKVSSMLAA